MTLMASHSSATAREQAPHSINSITNNILKLKPNSDDVRQRAWCLLRDKSIDEGSRSLIGYALEIDDPQLPELVRRAEAGESVVDNIAATNTPEDNSTERKVDTLAEMICRAHDPGLRAAALLVLMAEVKNTEDPKSLADNVKRYAFTRCGEMNVCGMVDVQIAALENELLTQNSHLS
jgi:hypothetical protein